jgi:hypothetical protein
MYHIVALTLFTLQMQKVAIKSGNMFIEKRSVPTQWRKLEEITAFPMNIMLKGK